MSKDIFGVYEAQKCVSCGITSVHVNYQDMTKYHEVGHFAHDGKCANQELGRFMKVYASQ